MAASCGGHSYPLANSIRNIYPNRTGLTLTGLPHANELFGFSAHGRPAYLNLLYGLTFYRHQQAVSVASVARTPFLMPGLDPQSLEGVNRKFGP